MISRKLCALISIVALCISSNTYADGIFEAGVIASVNGDVGQGFTTVNFQQTYNATPLVFLLTTNTGADPAAIRINNVTSSGFDAVIAEPPGPAAGHVDMPNVSYIAILPGRYELPNGSILEAGSHSTTTAHWNTGGTHDAVNFSAAFPTSPVVLADIQTLENETAAIPNANSNPWLTTTINSNPSGVSSISTTGFEVALERAETGSGNVATAETIGYLAMTSGHGSIASVAGFTINGGGSVEFDAGISADVIRGWTEEDAGGDGGGNAVSFTAPFTSAPDVVVASMATRDGADGGWLRGNVSTITATGLRIAVDEDTANDGERGHTTERASIVAFGTAFTAASALNQDVHFDDGSTDTAGAVDGSVGDNLWSNNINWRVNQYRRHARQCPQ